MRTLLAPSMLNVIVDNLKKGNTEGRLFEMAPVYLAKELPINEHPHERQTLCIGAFGPEEDFFTVKGALEALAAGFGLSFDYKRETTPWLHPGISAAVYCGDKRLGVFGKLSNEINGELEIAKDQKDSQNIYLGELDYEALMSCVDGELRYHKFLVLCTDFNPRSREGSDSGQQRCTGNHLYFNPRSREGSDCRVEHIKQSCAHFNPRSREGSDVRSGPYPSCQLYFNPRPREGSDGE